MSNDHYVPQFYLRNFAPERDGKAERSQGRSVRLINLARVPPQFVSTASIKGQCKRAGFYDYKPGLEAALSQLEALAASVIRGIISANVLPEPRSADHQTLADFTAIQGSRTLGAAEIADRTADRMFKVAYESDPRLGGIEPRQYQIMIAARCAQVLMQLGLHLLINATSEEFITSDNPVVAHNQYCEGITYQGVLGWSCSGIQIIFPVSPRHLIIFYDTEVYAFGTKAKYASYIVDSAEIRNLNEFQILAARENIYFRTEIITRNLLAQIDRLKGRRKHKRQITVQASPVAREDDTSELIHQFERIMPLTLSVSGLKIRRSKRRISPDRRAAMVRNPQQAPSSRPTSALWYLAKRSFSD